MTLPAEWNLNRGILDELAVRRGNFNASARALADCGQTRDVTRKTDQSMIEAAKFMFHKLLGEASDDLEGVTSQPHESLQKETTRNAHRCSRSATASEQSCSRSETLVGKCCSRPETSSCIMKLEPASKTRPSRESLEVADDDFRKQLELSVPLHKPGEWKYEFKMSSFTTTIPNLLFAEAEQKGKTRNVRTYVGPGSDGSSADKLSLDLKFNPWDTAITFRPEWRSTSKTVFTQCDPSESWYTEESDVWLDDVQTLYHRPMHCVIAVHPYFLAQDDTTLLVESAHLSCPKICIDGSRFSPDLYKDKLVTLNKRLKNELSNSAAFIAETDQVMWSLLTNTILHGRTIMCMVTPATEANMMTVGIFSKTINPAKREFQLTDNSMSGMRQHKAETSNTQIITTSTFFVQITKWKSMCSRSLTQSACASRR